MPRRRPPHFPHRLWLLLGLSLALLWAHSPFAPWAASRAPLWMLYDSLFYARFALGGWWLVEALRAGFLFADAHRRSARPAARLALLGAIAALALLGSRAYDSGPGLDLLTRVSQPALDAALAARAALPPGLGPDDDRRRRIGAFLVDNQRFPCGAAEPWLWLGRTFGAGTGINLALVRSGGSVPRTPDGGAFRFRPLYGNWWLAYQDGHAYALSLADGAAHGADSCIAGTVVEDHAAGRDFVAAGRERLGASHAPAAAR